MPGFDGTGPLGQGPFTGGGRGYCAVPLDYGGNIPYGYGAIQSRSLPLNVSYVPNYAGYGMGIYGIGYKYPVGRFTVSGRGFSGRGRGRGVRMPRVGFRR